MKRVILQEFVSVDGLGAGPNDSVDYGCERDPAGTSCSGGASRSRNP